MDPSELLTIAAVDGGLALAGEIDGHSSSILADALSRHSAERIAIDMSGVSFVDSSGLRVLIEAHQHAESAGGSMTLTNLSEPVTRLLEISGVDAYLDVDRG